MTDEAVILVVDDDAGDAMLAQRAFLKAKVLNPIQGAKSGEEAIAYLSGEGVYANREKHPMPSLVLLDLRMPGLDGFDVLRWIRQQPRLKQLRVVVLTASDSMRDISTAYQLGANSFLIKPVDFERFVEISQALGGCWLWSSKMPDAQPASGETETFIRRVVERQISDGPTARM